VQRRTGLRHATEVQGLHQSNPPPPLHRAGDYLVSVGFASAMEAGTGVGKGEEEEVKLTDVLRRCDVILELLWSFQPRKVVGDVLVASDGDTRAWAMTSWPRAEPIS
jgi:hypothetical protein